MDLFDLAGTEPKREVETDLFNIAGQESLAESGGDLFDIAGGTPAAATIPIEEPKGKWSEMTPGYIEEIAARSPGVGFFPFAVYAPKAREPMPELKIGPRPKFVETPPEPQETRFLKRPPAQIQPRRIPGPEGTYFELPAETQVRPEEEPSFVRDVVGGTVKKFGETALGAGETLAAFAGGLIEFLNPIPGLAGVAKILTGASPEEQTKVIRGLQGKFHPYLAYEPQTEEGKKGKALLEWAFENISKVGQTAGGLAQDVASVLGKTAGETAGATVGGAIEIILPALIFGRLGKSIKGEKGKAVDVEKTLAEIKQYAETNSANLARGIKTPEAIQEPVAAATVAAAAITERTIRTSWAPETAKAVLHSTRAGLSKTPRYMEAKKGNLEAATEIAQSLINKEKLIELNNALAAEKAVTIVPVRQIDAEGRNRIPGAFASLIAEKTGWEVDKGIYQINKVSRTGKNAIERLFAQPLFDGPVVPGRTYVIVDDMVTQGGTLASLKAHIERGGGKVAAIQSLRGSTFSNNLQISPETTAKIRQEFGAQADSVIKKIFGREANVESITEGEGRAILDNKGAVIERAGIGAVEGGRERGGEAPETKAGAAPVIPAPAPRSEVTLGFGATGKMQEILEGAGKFVKAKEPWKMTSKEFNEWFPRLRSVEQKSYERLYRSKITEHDDLPTAMQKYSQDFGYENPGLVARFKNIKPEDNVDIYRAISKDDPAGKIEPGDWVAIEYKYAKTHGAAGYGDVGSKIVKMKVPAKDVVWAGTSADEYFYAPQKLRDSSIQSTHEAVIKQALSEGKPVPPEVLKEYPDLAPKPLIAELGKAGELPVKATPMPEGQIRAQIKIEGKTVNGLAQDILSETPAKQNAAIESVKKAVEEGKITQDEALHHVNNEMMNIATEKIKAGADLNTTLDVAQKAGMAFTERIAKDELPPKRPTITVYRGYSSGKSAIDKNLTRVQTADELISKLREEKIKGPEMLPFEYYTESPKVAEGYAKQDQTFVERIMRNQGKTREGAEKSFEILVGRKPFYEGKVIETQINPTKILDLSQLGENPKFYEVVNALIEAEGGTPTKGGRREGIGDWKKFDRIEESFLSPKYIGESDNFPVWKLMRNAGKDDLSGSKFIEWMKNNGYDAVKFAEQGTNHYAVLKSFEPQKTTILGLGPTGELQKMYEILRKSRQKTDPLPKYARSVNLERQNIAENLKDFETEVAKLLPEKKVQTWDESGKLSDEILHDMRRLQGVIGRAQRGQALNAEEMLAMRTLNVTAINKLKEIVTTKTAAEANVAFENFKENIFKTTSDASSEAGRALNIHKKIVSPVRLAKALSQLKKGLNERQMEELKLLDPENMDAVQRFVDRLPDPALKDYFYEFWYNSILSGIPTHLVNFAGNTMWQAWNLMIHHPLSAGLDAMISKFTGRDRQIFFNEIFPRLAGIKSGVKKGWGGVKEVIKTGQAAEFQTKWDREIGGATASALERSPYAGLRAIAPYITSPSRALRAMDIWANSIAYDSALKGLIRREGLKRGLKDVQLDRFEAKFQPTEGMMKEAGDYAQNMTFMDDPGPISTAILNLREKLPLGRLLIPFVTTIGNLLKRGLEMTPGIGLAMGRGLPAAEIIAKQIEGSIIAFWVVKKAMDGDIIGPVPENVNEREAFYRQGKLPWSVRIGDSWYQYRRLEPFNTIIASAATAYDKIVRAKSQDKAADIFFDVARGMWENFLDTSYFSGPVQMLQRHGNIANMGLRQLSSMVPYSGFWRSVNRALETVFEDNAKVREVKTVLGALSQVIPGLWKEVPAKLDVWGEEIELPGNALRQWLPWKYSQGTSDRVEEELDRLKIYPAHPGKQVLIGDIKIELPEEFYRDYAIHFGKLAKDRMDKIVASPGYQKMPDEEKQKTLDRELRLLRHGEAMRAKREYVRQYGMPTEEMNLKKRIGG